MWCKALVFVVALSGACSAQPFWDLPSVKYNQPEVYIYRGPVSWGDGNATETDTLDWKMTILESTHRDGIRAWRISGFPADLAFYEPGKQPAVCAIVETGGGSQYFICGEEAFGRITNSSDSLRGLVRESEMVLDVPLEMGKRFGETKILTRNDGMYEWQLVESRDSSVIRRGVKYEKKIWTVEYRALSSVQIMEWMQGAGLLRYYYHHNGTPSDADMRLASHPRMD